jgi:hypothetical protein
MYRLIPLMFLATSCIGHATMTVAPITAFIGPKELVSVGERGEASDVLDDYLRDRGIRLKRLPTMRDVTRVVSAQRLESTTEPTVRYALELTTSSTDRCFGGGFKFAYFRVEVTDLVLNETVLTMKASGYSEKCQPMSGSIFTDVANQIAKAWPAPQQK